MGPFFTINTPPSDFDPGAGLPAGFIDYIMPLHRELTPRQQGLVARRAEVLAASQRGAKPEYLEPSSITEGDWSVDIPDWCADQRNQMTGPADDAELVVKMLNSGAPGVMLDLEDSMANRWLNLTVGIGNISSALGDTLTYFDKKRGQAVPIKESGAIIITRPRGLHISQAGIFKNELMAASLFDVAMIVYGVDAERLRHPLTFYIPKSESAEEALWWRDLFRALAETRGWPSDSIKCMALVESHPLAYQLEEFIYNLRDHILALNLGRWDYMASLIHFNLNDPEWVLPDRNTIPHDVPFFQNLRELMVEICHKRGVLAIGGMTALYPSRLDPELNSRALRVLAEDKRNEARCHMDGAWTGHPDQNAVAVAQFPYPNQLRTRKPNAPRCPDLRPTPKNVGKITLQGTRDAVRTVIRYRNGVLNGKGASLLDGYMEDLATDRIYRLMIAQRILHRDVVSMEDAEGKPVKHTPELINELFDQELEKLLRALPPGTEDRVAEKLKEARQQCEDMISQAEFDPV
jgi:malate synthase